ncbi:MAG TPA: hypothetical protein VFO19_06500 [Vicinamibacterales bacterium]|nr:hypothetical protein [Vicinamibacterales bacterium]
MRALPVRFSLAASVAVVALGGILSAGSPPQATEKTIYVSILDKNDRPVKGAGKDNFLVREDNLDVEVVKVEQAPKTPVAVVLLADTTTSFVPFSRDLRVASESFARAFLEKNPGSQVAIWEFGGADIPVVPFTNDVTKLAEGSKKLFPKGSISQAQADAIAAGAATARGQNVIASNLLEAIIGASKELAKREEPRRVIVSMNADVSVEASRVQGNKVQEEVIKANVQWFGLSLQAQVANGPLRDNVMNGLIPYSGGVRHTIVSIQALESELINMADIIANQYAVTYKRTAGEPKGVVVGLRGGPPDIKVAATRWASK